MHSSPQKYQVSGAYQQAAKEYEQASQQLAAASKQLKETTRVALSELHAEMCEHLLQQDSPEITRAYIEFQHTLREDLGSSSHGLEQRLYAARDALRGAASVVPASAPIQEQRQKDRSKEKQGVKRHAQRAPSGQEYKVTTYVPYSEAMKYITQEDENHGVMVEPSSRQKRLRIFVAQGLEVVYHGRDIFQVEMHCLQEKLAAFYARKGANVANKESKAGLHFFPPEILHQGGLASAGDITSLVAGREAITYSQSYEQKAGLAPRTGNATRVWLTRHIKAIGDIHTVKKPEGVCLCKEDLDRQLQRYVASKLKHTEPNAEDSSDKKKLWADIIAEIRNGATPEEALTAHGITDPMKRAGYRRAILNHVTKQNLQHPQQIEGGS